MTGRRFPKSNRCVQLKFIVADDDDVDDNDANVNLDVFRSNWDHDLNRRLQQIDEFLGKRTERKKIEIQDQHPSGGKSSRKFDNQRKSQQHRGRQGRQQQQHQQEQQQIHQQRNGCEKMISLKPMSHSQERLGWNQTLTDTDPSAVNKSEVRNRNKNVDRRSAKDQKPQQKQQQKDKPQVVHHQQQVKQQVLQQQLKEPQVTQQLVEQQQVQQQVGHQQLLEQQQMVSPQQNQFEDHLDVLRQCLGDEMFNKDNQQEEEQQSTQSINSLNQNQKAFKQQSLQNTSNQNSNQNQNDFLNSWSQNQFQTGGNDANFSSGQIEPETFTSEPAQINFIQNADGKCEIIFESVSQNTTVTRPAPGPMTSIDISTDNFTQDVKSSSSSSHRVESFSSGTNPAKLFLLLFITL